MDHRPSLPAAVGSGLRRQLQQSTALHSLLHSPPALTARRTAARAARRMAPETADRLIAEFKGTEPLLARIRPTASRARHRGAALRASAALTVAAVVGGMVAGTQSASAATRPTHHATTRSATTASSGTAAGAAGMPLIYPRAQSQQAYGQAVTVPASVTLVLAAHADADAVRVVRQHLTEAGALRILESTVAPDSPAPGSLTVYIGGISEGAGGGADRALRGLAAAGGSQTPLTPSGLPAGGYVLTAGQLPVTGGKAGTIVLAGVDADGTFNAAQSLAQLLVTTGGRGSCPGVRVLDWPSTAVRGTEEGFYGTPWTAPQTVSELDFLGRTKQNFFLYAPGDDPYRSDQWRDPYPAAQQAQLRAMTTAAALNHVTFGYALSIGGSVCYTSAADRNALIAKLESLWGLGVRAFQLQFTDVSYSRWNCQGDLDRYGQGAASAARAQSDLVALVLKQFVDKHPGAAPLSILPSEYYQSGATPYRTALSKDLDPSVQVAWTGVGVQPSVITANDLSGAYQAFAHPLVTQDNYPVNDSDPDRLHLGPYTGRDPSVATGSAALLLNAMQQPVASRIPLFTAADFAWNPTSYDADASWQAAVRALAADGASGPAEQAQVAAALTVLAGNDASSPLGRPESAYLQPLIAAFWAQQGDAGTGEASATAALRAAFTAMTRVPAELAGLDGGALSSEDGAWLAQLAAYGQAGQAAVDMLTAQRSGHGPAAWAAQMKLRQLVARLGASSVTVGAGVLDPFLTRALAASDGWAGVGGQQVTATATMSATPGHGASLMVDGNQGSWFESNTPPQAGDSVGVDLGSSQAIGEVRITMGTDGADDSSGSGGSGGSDEYLQNAVLQYSTGDGEWHKVATYRNQSTIVAELPAGTVARYVRLEALAGQDSPVAVRELTVSGPRSADRDAGATADGPAAEPGSPASDVVDGSLQTAYRAASAPQPGDALTVTLGTARPLDQVVVLTDPTVRSPGSVEVHEAGKGWVRIGALSDGYTQLPADAKVAVDGIRLVWAAGAQAPVVYQVVPWYADQPVAALQLPQQSLDVEAGGGTTELSGVVGATGAAGVSGTLQAEVPAAAKGLTVRTPGTVTLARGGRYTATMEVTAAATTPPGSYRVPVDFVVGSHRVTQVVQVQVHPLNTGPDLALTATTDSSNDASSDFASANAADGDPTTRWASSPVQDAWVQLKLARSVTVGEVVLHWADDYATQYEVETSPDGVTWYEGATVLDGQGGTETVYFTAPSTRYVRAEGVESATGNGYSLYGVEVYAAPDSGVPATPAPTGTAAPGPSPSTPVDPAPPTVGATGTPSPGVSGSPATPGPGSPGASGSPSSSPTASPSADGDQ